MFRELIQYDRSERNYKFADPESGEVFCFPSGPAGKLQAVQFVAQMVCSDVWETMQHWLEDSPQLERVLYKALDIVSENGVEVYPTPRAGNVMAHVMSSDGMGRYAVTADDHGSLECQCPHFTEGDAPYDNDFQQVCKHIGAYKLWIRTRAEW